jgi:DNA-binding LytR/AlgR family response regulator
MKTILIDDERQSLKALHAKLKLVASDMEVLTIGIEELKNIIETLNHQVKKAPPPDSIGMFQQHESRYNHLFETLKTMQNNQLAEKIALPTQEGVLFIQVKDILRVEAMSNYSNFFLLNKQRIIVSRTLKEFEEVLLPYNFFRANRSQIINLNQITKYQKGDGGVLHLTDGYEVEVSPQRKGELMSKLALPHR